MHEIEEKYSQRVASRIVGNCVPVQFCGRDVRQIINGTKVKLIIDGRADFPV